MRTKVSATLDPERLAQAKELTGLDNTSELLNRALGALIAEELERIHADGYAATPQGAEVVSEVDPSIWSDIPWDEE